MPLHHTYHASRYDLDIPNVYPLTFFANAYVNWFSAIRWVSGHNLHLVFTFLFMSIGLQNSERNKRFTLKRIMLAL